MWVDKDSRLTGRAQVPRKIAASECAVPQILTRAGLGRPDRGDRTTNTSTLQRYQRDLPGELIHIDVKELAGIPEGGGWRSRGRGYWATPTSTLKDNLPAEYS